MTIVYRHGQPTYEAAVERAAWKLRLMRASDFHDPRLRGAWMRRLRQRSNRLTLVQLGRGENTHVVLGPWEDGNDVLTVCGRASRNAGWFVARYDACPSLCCLKAEWPLVDGKVVADA